MNQSDKNAIGFLLGGMAGFFATCGAYIVTLILMDLIIKITGLNFWEIYMIVATGMVILCVVTWILIRKWNKGAGIGVLVGGLLPFSVVAAFAGVCGAWLFM